MDKSGHLSETDLMRFADRQRHEDDVAAKEVHVLSCAECRKRLQEIESALTAYDDYHAQILKPGLQATETLAWPSLAERLTELEKRERSSFFTPAMWWAMAATACCVAVLVVFFRWVPADMEMRQVLARAASAPAPVHRRLQFTEGARSWYRAAVLRGGSRASGMEHVEALFVRANYSWEEPLSARSFAAWRNGLREKRDQVSSVSSEDGRKRFYRVRTQTPSGALHSAALTLRADDFAAVQGVFTFEKQEEVKVADSGEMPEPAPGKSARQDVPGADRPAIESKASEEDELRVFTALNAIGADAGDPVNIDLDSGRRHVVITGMGIPAARQREIKDALAGVPNALVRFESARIPVAEKGNSAGAYSSDATAGFRRILEERAGSAATLEAITDRALEASNTLLAQAHALSVLGQRFAPAVEAGFTSDERETLRRLRRQHGAVMERAVVELGGALKPLMSLDSDGRGPDGTQAGAVASWQGRVAALFEAARELDARVSRLLGGSYTEEWGRDMLSGLPDELGKVEALAHFEATAE